MNPTHFRKGRIITTLATGKKETFLSINEAKRKSATIQKANGGLGRGAVVVK